MGCIYELLSTPAAYLTRAYYSHHPNGRTSSPISIPFGPHRLQHCVLYEPDEVRHETVVFYFHGGAYLLGDPESMIDAANVYNSQGYRFVSVGFRWVPFHPFPAQADDAFKGVIAGLSWLDNHDSPARRIVIGGTSCGGHLATMLCYGRELQSHYGLPTQRIAGCISVAGITHADDMMLRPFPGYSIWHRYVNLDTQAGECNGQTYGRRSRWAMHQAMKPWSPIEFLTPENFPPGQPPVPFFSIHGFSDKLSPYAGEVEFAARLNALAASGEEREAPGRMPLAQVFTLSSWKWQHMMLTVTLHRREVEAQPELRALFAWLDAIDSNC
ncbi:MAG: alpha/beta hydrolase [Eggerthellaceae bacterium]|jgi:acetyl esterase/lipase